MPVKVATVTLALAVPAFLWPPKPARAAPVDCPPAISAPAAHAPGKVG
jgi:hypothetical protein